MEDILSTIRDTKNKLEKKLASSPIWTRGFLYIFLGCIGLCLAASFIVSLFFRSKKVAKALHKADVAEETLNKASTDAEIAKLEAAEKDHVESARSLEAIADKSLQQISVEKEATKEENKIIENLETWEDVEKHIKF